MDLSFQLTPRNGDYPIIHMDAYDFKKTAKGPVLDFTLLSNPLGPSLRARNPMRKALKDVHRHPDPRTRRLRRFLAAREHIDPENLLFGHGSTQILDAILAAYRPGKVLLPSPLSPHYELLAGRHEGCPLPACEGPGVCPMPDALTARLPDVDALFLPNPHMVTGAVAEKHLVEKIISAFAGSRALLVIDEALAGFAALDSPVAKVVQSANVVIVRSFSFFYALAGLRLGYAIEGSFETCGRIAAAIGPGPVNIVAEAGALASMRDTGYPARTAAFLGGERAYMLSKLTRIKGVAATETACNFIIVTVATAADALLRRLLARNVLVDIFKEQEGTAYLRVPLRTRRENARFVRALARAVAEGRAS